MVPWQSKVKARIQNCSLTYFSAASQGLSLASKNIEINYVIGNSNMVMSENIELVFIPRAPKAYQM